jgi:hypothetical protein
MRCAAVSGMRVAGSVMQMPSHGCQVTSWQRAALRCNVWYVMLALLSSALFACWVISAK